MEYRHLLVDREGHIGRLTLNRPERLNALNFRIGIELLDALDECDRDANVRVVILTGAGRAFCAGDDLRGMAAPGEPDRRYADPLKQYVEGEGRWPLIVARLRALSKPVIAMVNGHAHGAGFNLALGCDLRVASATATLAIPFARRGIATGTNLLQQFVGIGKALEMGAASTGAFRARRRTMGPGQLGRAAGAARAEDVGGRARARRGTDRRARLHEVRDCPWMGRDAARRLSLPGAGHDQFTAHRGLPRRYRGLSREAAAALHWTVTSPAVPLRPGGTHDAV